MSDSTIYEYCKSNSGYYNYCMSNYKYIKYPKLMELHKLLFGYEFARPHNALNDTIACAKCFFELKRLDIVKI
jgi:DNA polymerase III epsilon subunit-like protein